MSGQSKWDLVVDDAAYGLHIAHSRISLHASALDSVDLCLNKTHAPQPLGLEWPGSSYAP
jgi:hypothetical protein